MASFLRHSPRALPFPDLQSEPFEAPEPDSESPPATLGCQTTRPATVLIAISGLHSYGRDVSAGDVC